jgi:uncharacterized glyoxalase superfamily protein PhnB
MTINRAMPRGAVIPELAYPDVEAAADWLCAAFGFTLRFRFGAHRAQLNIGDGGAMVVTGRDPQRPTAGEAGHSVMVRIADVDAHHALARAAGATILTDPQDFEYGERQYSVADLGGHRWTFTQSIFDFDPATFGAIVGRMD